jgi:hypothetical protein
MQIFDLNNNFYYSIFGGNSLKIKNCKVGSTKSFDYPKQEYIHNSYGYRGGEFSSSHSLLAAGCSFTYGVGVPQGATWWNQVCNRLNLQTSAPVAGPGASVSWIVEKLFAYFAEFGHPKYLLCLFPDYYRISIPIDGKVLKVQGDDSGGILKGEHGTFGLDNQRLYMHHVLVSKNPEDMPKYSKRPHNVEDIYTIEITIFEAIRSIRVLEQYCAAVGINLQWTTWDDVFSSHIEKANKIEDLKFKNFFSLGFSNFKEKTPSGVKDSVAYGDRYAEEPILEYCPEDCHEELKQLYGEENFDLGTDTSRGGERAHPGIHVHAHYADRFIEQLMLEYPHEFK